VVQLTYAFFELDQWIASAEDKPTVASLTTEIRTLFSGYNGIDWREFVHNIVEYYYAGLALSAYFGGAQSFTEVLGLFTRWLLVVALVDTLEFNAELLSSPDDIYYALRWRILVLPDAIVLLLSTIRSQVRKSILVRKPGFADLYITREEWDHYEYAEIASIENILGGELKSRVHILVNQTTTTTTTDVTTTTLKEQDTTTTDLSQLQQQSTSDINLAAHIDGQVDTSGQYGPTQVDTHLGGSLDYSTASSQSKAVTQSHETVSRAVNRIEQTTRLIRTVSTLTRATDKEKHQFDNTKQTTPIVGIYRWVDQIQNVELDRYPHRLLMEFEIPEPGAWTRWLHLNDATATMINKPPLPLTVDGNPVTASNPVLRPTDILGDQLDVDNTPSPKYYQNFLVRYNATGASPPPAAFQVIAINIGYPSTADKDYTQVPFRYQSDTTTTVPPGYQASSWCASYQFSNLALPKFASGLLDMSVGGGKVQESTDYGTTGTEADHIIGEFEKGAVGPISQGEIPVAVQARNVNGFQINIEITCDLLDQTFKQWQLDTYGIILDAYNTMLQAYNDEKAGLKVQQTNLADAYSPEQNAVIIKQELKRQVIEMLIGTPFLGVQNAIDWDISGKTQPSTNLSVAAAVAPEIQFLEQAFEWETLSYICYPYYWADSSRWRELAGIQGNDPAFVDFLRAGSARVVLAARPGFENQVNFYVATGILWGAGPIPAPGDENYLSIADEIREQQQRPLDVTVIDAWQVRLPTTLIALEHDGLPSNPNPTILVITRIYPTSGAVGDVVTIVGSNFGPREDASIITFNGSAAKPLSWGPYRITMSVPAGATTGNVVVNVNALASNGVRFTVITPAVAAEPAPATLAAAPATTPAVAAEPAPATLAAAPATTPAVAAEPAPATLAASARSRAATKRNRTARPPS
jgi:hypothetical protein